MAEQFDSADKKSVTTTVVTREGAKDGAEIYPEPKKRGFPWWVLLLGLIPLFALWYQSQSRPGATDRAPIAATTPGAATSPEASASPERVAVGVAPSGDVAASPMAGLGAGASSSPSTEGKDRVVYQGKDITVAPQAGASKEGEPLSDVITFSQTVDKKQLLGRRVKLTDVAVTEVVSPNVFAVGKAGAEHMLVLLDPRLNAGVSGEKVSLAEGNTVSITGILQSTPNAKEMQSVYAVKGDATTAHADDEVYLHATIVQQK